MNALRAPLELFGLDDRMPRHAPQAGGLELGGLIRRPLE